jgi:hypothetical protein
VARLGYVGVLANFQAVEQRRGGFGLERGREAVALFAIQRLPLQNNANYARPDGVKRRLFDLFIRIDAP